jgi:uncharacterized protein (DUF362 family)
LDRRTFIKAMLAAGAQSVLLDLDGLVPSVPAVEKAVLGMAEDPSPALAARKAVSLVGGFGRFVPKGSRVVVKPNIGWDRTVEQGANTHPELVKAVIEGCLAAGAAQIKVFDRTCNDPRLTYRSSGIEDAVKSIGDRRVEIFIPDRRKYVPVDVKKGKIITHWSFYEDALKADVFINLPVLKHHSLCRLTMGMKNVMGVMGDNRGAMHQDFKVRIADVNTVIVSHLTVLDATRILTRRGPQGGDPRDVRRADTVIAGADIVAVDSLGARLFGLAPGEVDYLIHAAERGLGQADLDRVEIRKG